MKYEEIFIGLTSTFTRRITLDDVLRFKLLSGDANKLHYLPSYAQNNGFENPVVYGVLIEAFISNLIGNKLPGDGALWVDHDINFLEPVYVNDIITISAFVATMNDATKIIKLYIDVINQDDKKVVMSIAHVKCLE